MFLEKQLLLPQILRIWHLLFYNEKDDSQAKDIQDSGWSLSAISPQRVYNVQRNFKMTRELHLRLYRPQSARSFLKVAIKKFLVSKRALWLNKVTSEQTTDFRRKVLDRND